jgi:hypothetical protein
MSLDELYRVAIPVRGAPARRVTTYEERVYGRPGYAYGPYVRAFSTVRRGMDSLVGDTPEPSETLLYMLPPPPNRLSQSE